MDRVITPEPFMLNPEQTNSDPVPVMSSQSYHSSTVFRNELTLNFFLIYEYQQFKSEIFRGQCGASKVSWYYVVNVFETSYSYMKDYSVTIAVMIETCSTPLNVSVKLDPGRGSHLPSRFKIWGRAEAGTTLGEIEISCEDFKECFTIKQTMFRLKFSLSPGCIPEPEESQLLKAYTSLLSNEQLSDVTITIGQRKFYAQRAILSVRSAVFAAMFQSGMQESKQNCTISVEDIEPDVFQEVLRFIYTDQVKGLETMAHDLLAAADKYALDKLKNMCAKHLCGHITKETVLQTLVQADLYRVQELKDAAVRFVSENTKQMHAADWKSFCGTNPDLVAEIFSKM